MQIVPQRFNELLAEMRAGRISLKNLVAGIEYAREVAHSGASGNAARIHRFDFREPIPASFFGASEDIQQAVQYFYKGLPDAAGEQGSGCSQ